MTACGWLSCSEGALGPACGAPGHTTSGTRNAALRAAAPRSGLLPSSPQEPTQPRLSWKRPAAVRPLHRKRPYSFGYFSSFLPDSVTVRRGHYPL